jgi:nitrogen regulatory protein P-II 1
MKQLVMVVHANVQQDLSDRLRAIAQVQGFTFSHVEGHSHNTAMDRTLSPRDKVVGHVPRVRVDIMLEEADVALVLEALRCADCGIAGNGVYWVIPVEQCGRL